MIYKVNKKTDDSINESFIGETAAALTFFVGLLGLSYIVSNPKIQSKISSHNTNKMIKVYARLDKSASNFVKDKASIKYISKNDFGKYIKINDKIKKELESDNIKICGIFDRKNRLMAYALYEEDDIKKYAGYAYKIMNTYQKSKILDTIVQAMFELHFNIKGKGIDELEKNTNYKNTNLKSPTYNISKDKSAVQISADDYNRLSKDFNELCGIIYKFMNQQQSKYKDYLELDTYSDSNCDKLFKYGNSFRFSIEHSLCYYYDNIKDSKLDEIEESIYNSFIQLSKQHKFNFEVFDYYDDSRNTSNINESNNYPDFIVDFYLPEDEWIIGINIQSFNKFIKSHGVHESNIIESVEII